MMDGVIDHLVMWRGAYDTRRGKFPGGAKKLGHFTPLPGRLKVAALPQAVGSDDY